MIGPLLHNLPQPTMSDQLTKEQQEFAHKAATTIFNCFVLTESHAAALRQDPSRCAEANERIAANAASLVMSSMPSSLEELEEHIKLNEELIKSMEGCTEFDEYVSVVLI
jgi:predicted alpha/beta-fold hydrolase